MENELKLHSQGGRLYILPSDIFSSEKGKELLEVLKRSKTYKQLLKKKNNKAELVND